MINRRFLRRLLAVLPSERTSTDVTELSCYSYDAYFDRGTADLLVRPRDAQDVQNIVRLCTRFSIPFVVRGAGTGYAGGSVPLAGGVVICLTEMTMLKIDRVTRSAWAQAGVTTGEVMRQANAVGLRYPPDPSSYNACTVGGNIATNAGGAHCLGYGVTSNYVLECEVVLPGGELVRFGGNSSLIPFLDVRGLFIGSEGTLGVVTAAKLRLIPQPRKIMTIFGRFSAPQPAIRAMMAAFQRAIIPEAYDLMTGIIKPGTNSYYYEGETIAFIDVEGDEFDVDRRVEVLRQVISENDGQTEIMERGRLMEKRLQMTIDRWRKIVANTSALRYFLFDAVVPRGKVQDALDRIAHLAYQRQLTITSTFHAGDGNLHPCPFFDPTDRASDHNRVEFWRDVFNEVHELDGILSGEHGIGSEKIDLMHKYFFQESIALMSAVKDTVDPKGVANPLKKLATKPSIKRNYRSWEAPFEDRILVAAADGYIQVSGDCCRAEINSALFGSPYELAFDPMAWDNNVSVEIAIRRGRPSLDEDAFGPCRDRFLGGAFVSHGGQRLIIGSPFAKDVTGFDLRKLAYGADDKLGRLEFAWLALRARRLRYVGRVPFLCEKAQEDLDVRELLKWSCPPNSICLRGSGTDWELIVILAAARTPSFDVIEGIEREYPGQWVWESEMDSFQVAPHGTASWLFRELPDFFPASLLRNCSLFPNNSVVSPFGGFSASPIDHVMSDTYIVNRPDEHVFSQRLGPLIEGLN